MPVGFVPLHCFCISPTIPPVLSFSCDSKFSDKKQSYVALGQVVLFTVVRKNTQVLWNDLFLFFLVVIKCDLIHIKVIIMDNYTVIKLIECKQ